MISTCFFDSLPNVFFSLSLSMEIPVNGGRSGTAICFHNPVNNIFYCFVCVFLFVLDSESGRAKSHVGEDPVDHGAVQETSAARRQMKTIHFSLAV